MADRTLNDPLSGAEIKAILVARFSALLDNDSTLSDDIAYAGFRSDWLVNITFLRSETPGTMSWGTANEGTVDGENEFESLTDAYTTDSPNAAREDHDLGLPVLIQTPAGAERRIVRRGRPPKIAVQTIEEAALAERS